jgi:hypothetical protein
VLVAVNAANIGVRPALVADFPLQQAIVYGVLHLGGVRSLEGELWRAPRTEWESRGEANGRASRVIALRVHARSNQSGCNFSRSGLAAERLIRIAVHSHEAMKVVG